MKADMASANDRPLATWATRDGRRLLRNLLGGLVILVVWLSLWAWVALGVVRPLSRVPPLFHGAAAISQRV